MKSYEKGIGYRYLLETKYYPNKPFQDDLGLIKSPPLYKTYPTVPRIILPRDFSVPRVNLAETIAARRTQRKFTTEPLSLSELAFLLWTTQGITSPQGYRAAPSAGALYPIETYLSVQNIKDVPAGIYHFNVRDFCLERLKEGNFASVLTEMALGQSMVRRAAVVFIWTAVILRSMSKYRNRAIRYIFLDAGHICQNLLLATTALGLGACPIGAFYDEEIDRLIGVDSHTEMTIYLAVVGRV
jgi:SagB-type dehydrogenase family enzyme